jgi:four helix bundle protein
MGARNYRDLNVWQKAMELCEAIYRASKNCPKEEQFGLTSQMRRAAVSIPSNIAEGQGRGSDKEWTRYLNIAYGSLRELETQIMIAHRLGYFDSATTESLLILASEVGRLINGMKKSLDNAQ